MDHSAEGFCYVKIVHLCIVCQVSGSISGEGDGVDEASWSVNQ